MYGVFYKNKGKLVGPYLSKLGKTKEDIEGMAVWCKREAKKKPLIYKVKVTPIIK